MYITTNILYITAGSIGLFALIVLAWLFRLQFRLKKVLVGKNAASLEDSLHTIVTEVKELQRFTRDMELYLTTVETRLKKSIQGVETIRYNPFKGTGSGGNNSFSTTLLDQQGNGVVLTSMYARDRISMFAKPVKAYTSEYELSDEELESINKCKQKITITS
jgi:hypothetical protein